MLSWNEHGKCFITLGPRLIKSSKQSIQMLEKANAKALIGLGLFCSHIVFLRDSFGSGTHSRVTLCHAVL